MTCDTKNQPYDFIKSSSIFRFVFDAQEIYSSDGVWIAFLMRGKAPNRSYHHTAFQIKERVLPIYQNRMEQLNLEILSRRPRDKQEGISLYFYDYDNILLNYNPVH